MNSIKKKYLSCLLTLAMVFSFLPLFSIQASAASYPSIYPDEYDITVTQGETAELIFTIFHEFKNEHAYVKVHRGSRSGSVVATADRSFTNSYTSMTEWTVNWDTSDVEPGDYVVEYYMTFYSLYSWHETPSHSYLLTVHVEAPPCQNGHSYNAGKITKQPSCGVEGVKTFTCTECGDKRKEPVPAVDHTWDDGTVTTAPTTSKDGIKTFKCTTCKDKREEVIKAIFTDVSADAYYASAVEWAYNKGVTSGSSATTFSPDAICTRSQVVTFLWRGSGSPEPTTTVNPFTDVKETDWYYKPVLWAVESGITAGSSPTTFSPDLTCSNAQILTFLWASQGKPEATGQGAWYDDPVNWAINNNLLEETGTENDIHGASSRANVVTFIGRVLDEDIKKEVSHNYGEWSVKKAATCSAEGTMTRKCKDCKFTQTRPIAKTPHTFGNADCTTPKTCVVCGVVEGSANGHTWVAATCSSAKTCSVCKATEGAPLPHSYKNGVCSVCNTRNPNYIKQNLVYKDSKVIISFKEVTSKGVVFEVENLTNANITIQADSIAINKKSTENITMSDDVAPGSIGDVVARCSFNPNEPVGMISGQLRIIDFDKSFDSYDARFADVIIDSDVTVTQPPVPKTLLYSDSRVKIYYKDVDTSGVTFTVQNLTSANITIQADSVSMNKRSTDNITMSDDVAPYSVGDVRARCTPGATTDIQTVGGTLRIIDFNKSFQSYNATFINVPVVK